jgi:hypothetical protein
VNPDSAFTVTDATSRYSGATGAISVAITTQPPTMHPAGTISFGSPTPTTQQDCLRNGWRNVVDAQGLQFKNQGTCVAYAIRATHGHTTSPS